MSFWDIKAPAGTPIYAVCDGIIIKADRKYTENEPNHQNNDGGNSVQIKGEDGTIYYYGHMSKIEDGIANSITVKKGDVIGYVGQTGNAYGNHLHFAVTVNGKKVDPNDYIGAIPHQTDPKLTGGK